MHLWVARGDSRRSARRGIATTILARYVGIRPGELEFARRRAGKPELLTPAPSGRVLHFSTSSAPDLFAVAVAAGPVGVDVEPRRRRVSTNALIEAFCTPSECDELGPMGEAARREAFIWCWTGKEACAKASGLGLGAPLEEIEAGVGPVPGARAVGRIPGEAAGPLAGGPLGPWTLHRVALPDYAVAIAVL